MLFARKAISQVGFLSRRSFHRTSALSQLDSFEVSSKKWWYRVNGYNKYGLLYHDLLDERQPEVKEAIRRLPEDQQMQMKYRAIRACQLLINNSLLPKEEWTKFEDDHYFLQPYLDEIEKEWEEIEEWEAKY